MKPFIIYNYAALLDCNFIIRFNFSYLTLCLLLIKAWSMVRRGQKNIWLRTTISYKITLDHSPAIHLCKQGNQVKKKWMKSTILSKKCRKKNPRNKFKIKFDIKVYFYWLTLSCIKLCSINDVYNEWMYNTCYIVCIQSILNPQPAGFSRIENNLFKKNAIYTFNRVQ